MTKFIELVESGRDEVNHFDAELVAEALKSLVEYCAEVGSLRCEGVWRLHRQEASALEERYSLRPPGGWRALCSLAVGTGLLRADEEKFVVGMCKADTWCDDVDQVRIRLVESFTRWLIPPATAAGLFLAMDVHPLWGLRLARRLHVDAPMLEGPLEGWRDEVLLPDEDLSELRKGVFAAMSVVMSGLRNLQPHRRYGREMLVGFVSEALAYGCEQIEESGLGLEVLIDGGERAIKGRARSMEFAAQELFDRVLVPAGVMRCYDDESCGVDGQALQAVQVGHLGRDAQRTWFRYFLANFGEELTACCA